MELVNPGAANSESNPYKIETCEDFEYACSSDNKRYYRVENDLDFNEKGDDWFCSGYYSDNGSTIDLNGHTIKNIMCRPNKDYFIKAYNESSFSLYFKNGKFLNLFANGNYYMFYSCNFTKISFSINSTSSLDNTFYNCKLYSCSIYIKNSNALANVFYNTYLENSYVKVEVDNLHSEKSIFKTTNYVTMLQDCRISGYVKGSTTTPISDTGYVRNCVINLNLENFETTVSSYLFSNDINSNNVTTGVVNTSIINSNLISKINPNLLQADSAQIKNPVWLNENGFAVNKIETEPEDPSIT